MEIAEALRSIGYDLLEYIQKKVRLDFDNVGQAPVSFSFAGKTHAIGKVLGRFRTLEEHPLNAFLVHVESGEIYFLYFHFLHLDQHKGLNAGYWILCFRILNDNELMAFYREGRKMLLSLPFKRVVDFHGHLCPDLVIGGKLCEFVQKHISENTELVGELSIIAENCTSALDSIQVLLGATVGNQRLQIVDYGKHNYTLLTRNAENNLKFFLKQLYHSDEDLFIELEKKIMNDQAVLEDVVHFQILLDQRVQEIFAMPPEALFETESIEKIERYVETASVYLRCDNCGQQVLKSRKIDYQEKIYCLPCFQRISNCYSRCSLQ